MSLNLFGQNSAGRVGGLVRVRKGKERKCQKRRKKKLWVIWLWNNVEFECSRKKNAIIFKHLTFKFSAGKKSPCCSIQKEKSHLSITEEKKYSDKDLF